MHGIVAAGNQSPSPQVIFLQVIFFKTGLVVYQAHVDFAKIKENTVHI